jgi:hypothetical protein
MAKSRKMTYQEYQKMTYRDWPNPGLRQAGIGQALKLNLKTDGLMTSHLPELIGIFIDFPDTKKRQ